MSSIENSLTMADMFKAMANFKASDLFISPGIPPCIKLNGALKPLFNTALNPDICRQLILSIMTDKQREEFEKTKECNFAVSQSKVGRFRVSAYFQRNFPTMVIRRIETQIPTMESLGLPDVIRTLAMTKRGIIIFVGATGAGKTSSLAAMINFRNHNSHGHIITIEDPIEFVHPHGGCVISQREVGIDTENWEVALKNTLRQAPDVILIGEIRTRETMDFAISFAETGHLVLCTLHANNANQALDRIINFFPEERKKQLLMDLSLNLKAIVAQQLIPKVGGNGRVAAMEILIKTSLIEEKIREGKVDEIKEAMKESTNMGMQTFDDALIALYRSGDISYEDALKHADSSNNVRVALKLSQPGGGSALRSQNPGGYELT